MLLHRRAAPLAATVVLLTFAAPALAQDGAWMVSVGQGVTNRWFCHDVDEAIEAVELRAGWGRPLSHRLTWLVTLDYGSYRLLERQRASSWGITPQLRHARGALVFDGGLGLMRNDISSPGFTYRYKWTPQAGVGIRLFHSAAREVVLSYSLVHYSHSKLTHRRNVGINLNLVRLSVLWLN